jgi:protein TonB
VQRRKTVSFLRRVVHQSTVLVGSSALTAVFFLVLPLIQAIAKPPSTDLLLTAVDTANLPPPPPPPPEAEPEKEPEPEEQPPELAEEPQQPLDLAQLELALNPGMGDGGLGGSFAVQLNAVTTRAEEVEALFTLADLDQEPRAIYQPSPVSTAQLRKKAPGTVHILFVVDQQGRVENPRVQRSTDPVFEKPALAAVKQWRFEPGKRNGQAVRFRMRVPVTFPAKGSQ